MMRERKRQARKELMQAQAQQADEQPRTKH